jgi:hypothetical protein
MSELSLSYRATCMSVAESLVAHVHIGPRVSSYMTRMALGNLITLTLNSIGTLYRKEHPSSHFSGKVSDSKGSCFELWPDMQPSCTHLHLVTRLKVSGVIYIHFSTCLDSLQTDCFTFTLPEILWFLCLCLCILAAEATRRESDILYCVLD